MDVSLWIPGLDSDTNQNFENVHHGTNIDGMPSSEFLVIPDDCSNTTTVFLPTHKFTNANIGQSSALRHAVIGLGGYHWGLVNCGQDVMDMNDCDRIWRTHRGHALHDIRSHLFHFPGFSVLENNQRQEKIEALCGVIHLICLDILTGEGESDNLLTYIEAAVNLLAHIHFGKDSVTCEEGTKTPRLIDRHGLLTHEQISEDSETLSVSLLSAATFRFAILWSASARRRPIINERLERNVALHHVKMQHMFGCQVWVIASINEIVKLDYWRRELDKTRQLSITELVTRAESIKEAIEEGLEVLKADEKDSDECSVTDRTTIALITEIFASAAMTYLHIVVSGPHPTINEIQRSVVATIRLFETIADTSWVKFAVWPLCVTGCLAATAEQRNYVERLLLTRDPDPWAHRQLQKSLEAMKECWRRRDKDDSVVDWSVMGSWRGVMIA
ncbi:transcriptional regulatory protein ume6 [Phlyctema vagabunda]|uniref:Transcriptional regulatory protein ume6 n=1 Tax=Phlyctema vagabunda TaxID=108571 RepID=A0ABR4PA98_9HELO